MSDCTYCKKPIEECACAWGFDHNKAKQLILEARGFKEGTREQELANMLEEAMTFDMERRTYYDSFKLVQEDRHKKMAELAAANEEIAKLRILLTDALYIIDDCPEHPDKNQHTNAIEGLREVVEGFSSSLVAKP
jgi:hypothetical protein